MLSKDQKVIECNARKVNFVLPLRIEVNLKEMYTKDLLNNCLSSHQHQKRDSFIRMATLTSPLAFLHFKAMLENRDKEKGFPQT